MNLTVARRLVLGAIAIVSLGALGMVIFTGNRTSQTETAAVRTPGGDSSGCSIAFGPFEGKVEYDTADGYHYVKLRGVRFPLKGSPMRAQEVHLDAPGRTLLEKNTALLHSMLGPDVAVVRVAVSAEDKNAMPAATDIARYLQMTNRRKFGGLVYLGEDEKTDKAAEAGRPTVSEGAASPKLPLVVLQGPDAGSVSTRVAVASPGVVRVEGKTYEELYDAAGRICVTLLRMLCGSSDCPDASACASGGSCGCG